MLSATATFSWVSFQRLVSIVTFVSAALWAWLTLIWFGRHRFTCDIFTEIFCKSLQFLRQFCFNFQQGFNFDLRLFLGFSRWRACHRIEIARSEKIGHFFKEYSFNITVFEISYNFKYNDGILSRLVFKRPINIKLY